MMDPKRRACLALEALVEAIQHGGTKTIAPEFLMEKLMCAREDPRPESMIAPLDSGRFWRTLTTEELAQLIDEYHAADHLDLERGAMTALDVRQRSVRV